jgi:hypothetical protein
MDMKRVMLICFLGWVVALGLSCAPSIITLDTGVYQNGILYATSSKDLTAVYDAALAAMAKFEFQVAGKVKDAFFAKIDAKSADGMKIIVQIKTGGENRTDFLIKVESFNRERSVLIFDEIQKHLGVKAKK